jgi:hypothetical protein
MNREEILAKQQRLIDRYEQAAAVLKRVPGVLSVGVGARERRGELLPEIVYRVYVAAKIDEAVLPKAYRVPKSVCGFPTDVIVKPDVDVVSSSSSGVFVPNWDTEKYRPLRGGSQVRTEKFEGDNRRGMGTIGCLATTADGKMVALTTQHVACAGTEFNVGAGSASSGSGAATGFACAGVKVGQPRHITCCCCCTYNEIGAVLRSQKTAELDCAIVDLDQDTKDGVTAGSTLNEVAELGTITGVAQAVCFSEVRKRGIATRLTRGTVVDVLYEGSQILINPLPEFPRFAYFGDSGAVIVDGDGKVVGLLWGADRATRNRGVANHIGPVLAAMSISIAGQAGAGLGIPAANCGPSEAPVPGASSSSSARSSSSSARSSSSRASSSSSRASSSSSSRRPSSSSSSCAPRTGHWHAGAIKARTRLIGCKATIETHSMRLPCEGTATFDAFSTVWTGITKTPVNTHKKWGQIGITRRRTSGVAAVVEYLKFEVSAGLARPADYYRRQEPGFPAVGTTQEYECVVNPATGRWEFFVAGVSKDTFTHAGWVNETGDRVDYTGEVFDLGSQMAGTAASKCHITACKFKQGVPTSSSSSSGLAAGAYVDAGLVAANIDVTDLTEHGAAFVSATAVDIWDKNP